MIHFGVGGGASVPVSHAKDALKNGYNGQAWVSLTPRGVPVTVRAAFDFQRHELEDVAVTPGFGPSVPTAAIDGGTNQVLAGLANLRFDLRMGAVEPYVTIGLGGYNLKTDPSGAGAAGSSATRFGVNGGAGLAVRISQIHLYLEGRVDNVYTEKGTADKGTLQLVPVTFGISY
jgi:opacity protein-like surface antigen